MSASATKPESDACFIYVTTGSIDEAKTIGRKLVETRLAACVNIIDPMISLYWWEGKVQEGNETVLIAKTTALKVAALTAAVCELHSYDCPCVIALPIVDGNAHYVDWIGREAANEVCQNMAPD